MSPALNPLRTKLLFPVKPPTLYHLSNSRNLHLRLAFQVRCSQGSAKQKPSPKKKIVLFGAAPPVSAERDRQDNSEDGRTTSSPSSSSSSSSPSAWRFVKRVPRKALSLLANLPLAIGEMGALVSLLALATIVDQGESLEYYTAKYPEESPVLGIFNWKWIVYPGFDHMWTSPVFLGLLVLLAASLMACTYTTQIPLVKVARRWSFLNSSVSIRKQEFTDSLPHASVQDLGSVLMGHGYEVFLKGPCLYAFKGLVGRFAPIGVHLALLLIMAGGVVSAAGSFKGFILVPQGLNFIFGDVVAPTGFLSKALDSFNTEVHVNRFYMDYYENGMVLSLCQEFHLFNNFFFSYAKKTWKSLVSINQETAIISGKYDEITAKAVPW